MQFGKYANIQVSPSLQIVGQDLLDPWDSTSKYAASRPTGHYLPGWSRCLLFKQDCPGDHSGDDETFLVPSAQIKVDCI